MLIYQKRNPNQSDTPLWNYSKVARVVDNRVGVVRGIGNRFSTYNNPGLDELTK